MKKVTLLLVGAVCGAALLGACGKSTKTESGSSAAKPVESQASENYYYVIKDTRIELNAEMASIVAKIGDPDDYFESDSCAFQGKDKVYTYGSIRISTYPKSGLDFVYTIELMDDTVKTEEGVAIGDARDAVVLAYGSNAEIKESPLSYTYRKGSGTLTFFFENNAVRSIIYTADTE